MAILANLVGGLVFQIGADSPWHTTKTGEVSGSHPVMPPAPRFNGLYQKENNELSTGLGLLGWLYEFRDFQAVAAILRDKPQLIGLLVEMYGQICIRFGPENPITLDRFFDPEAQTHNELVIIVRTLFTPEVAMKALDNFDMEWWLEALPRAQNKVIVTVEYMT